MRVSLNWLKDYVDIRLSPQELAELLTMSGLEVEALEPVGGSLEDVVAARILSVRSHPQADRLFICDVDTGKGVVQVISSAPNLAQGAVVPLALPGARLPGGVEVRETRFRGEKSVGVLLAEDEMGLTDDHSGIMILPEDLRPGSGIVSALSLEDWVLDIGLTPNRPDCASVLGIAREVAAITNTGLRPPVIEFVEEGPAAEDLAGVTIEDPLGCPRYAVGMVLGARLDRSPFWMRYRLHLAGMRGINNVVDVTNYVMLEMGQPLHAFDHDRLKEHRIVVKRAKRGETFTTLDGEARSLDPEILMIRDGERSVAVAGIMGGLNSEIFAGSTNILIESAYFDPVTVRKGAKRLNLATEASYRFERGIDIEGVPRALRRSMMLIARLTRGKIAKGIIDQYPSPPAPRRIDLRIDRANRFLGTSLTREAMTRYLKALEMEARTVNENLVRVTPPTFRVDIEREADLVEEVARLEGYDRIPVTYPAVRPSEEGEIPELVLRDRTREIMVGLGFSEIITYSFISPDPADFIAAEEESELRSFVRLLNPLTTEQSVMRTSLVPGMLSTAQANFTHGQKDLRLFEWGKVFIRLKDQELPLERPVLTGMVTGLFTRKTWYGEERQADFFDIKGAVETLLDSVGLEDVLFRREQPPPWYDPDYAAGIFASGVRVGDLGKLSPALLEKYNLTPQDIFIFELNIPALMEKIPPGRRFEPLARFPAVLRDISVIVNRNIESRRIQEIIQRVGGKLVEEVTIFDLFSGRKLGPDEKALTFRVSYRSREGTLDGKEVNRIHEAIIEGIGRETGGRLREA